ncbi:hypothetical protein FMEAI12_4320031 [Parafrankia sp. Ea1.12]|nr:hypothetical protein FMEAI12_4320031 [Parafrankia sp. Ea1.12]
MPRGSAAYLHLYGLVRDEVEHAIDSFFVLRKNGEKALGEFRTRRLVLTAYDAMTTGGLHLPVGSRARPWSPSS